MSCKILQGEGEYCLYDSTKMVAFGPVMGDSQEAEAFIGYLDDKGFPDPQKIGRVEIVDYWYPHFVPWYKQRLCVDCDTFETETRGGVCDSCNTNRRTTTDGKPSDGVEEAMGHGGVEGEKKDGS